MSRRLVGVGLWLATLGLLVAPAQALACPVCFGAVDSPMARGTNWAIFALLGITGGVLCAFAAFFVYLLKRSRMALGQEASVRRSVRTGGEY